MPNNYRPLPKFLDYHIQKFTSLIRKGSPEECWVWTGTKSGIGYGRFGFKKQAFAAHRLAFFLEYGIDPGDLLVCHKCDNPPCCNPNHLFLGTHLDNVRDCISKKRHCFGERKSKAMKAREFSGPHNPNCVLSEQEVHMIREHFNNGMTQTALAPIFGVSQAHISKIVRRVWWKHLD